MSTLRSYQLSYAPAHLRRSGRDDTATGRWCRAGNGFAMPSEERRAHWRGEPSAALPRRRGAASPCEKGRDPRAALPGTKRRGRRCRPLNFHLPIFGGPAEKPGLVRHQPVPGGMPGASCPSPALPRRSASSNLPAGPLQGGLTAAHAEGGDKGPLRALPLSPSGPQDLEHATHRSPTSIWNATASPPRVPPRTRLSTTRGVTRIWRDRIESPLNPPAGAAS